MASIRSSMHQVLQAQQLGFYVRSCGIFTLAAPDREVIRTVDFAELFWCISGLGSFRLQGRDYLLQPEQIWYYPPQSTHDFHPASDLFHYCWLTLEGPGASAIFDGLALQPGCNGQRPCPLYLFERIIAAGPPTSAEQQLNNLNLALQILTQATPYKSPELSRQDYFCKEARRLIEDHYNDPNLNVEALAGMLKIHRVTLSKAFSSAFQIPISQYLLKQRLDKAKQLLHGSNLPARSIARLAGFSSAEYFSRIFRRSTSLSPLQYRALQMQAPIADRI